MAYSYDRMAGSPVNWRKLKEMSPEQQAATLKPILQQVERDRKKVHQTIERATKELDAAKKDEAELNYDHSQISDHLAILKNKAKKR